MFETKRRFFQKKVNMGMYAGEHKSSVRLATVNDPTSM
jgi:hypothetical protein